MLNRRRLTALALALVMALPGGFQAFAAVYALDPMHGIKERGNVYSDLHPDVTDPEYLIKKYYCYPGEPDVQEVEPEFAANTENGMKIPYNLSYPCENNMVEALPILQEFVHSFDWIHSDEKTRIEKIFETFGCGRNGNEYGRPLDGGIFLTVRLKKGVCADYANDFKALCHIVGLECVDYYPSMNHEANLVKCGDNWYIADMTNMNTGGPVDFDTEYNRAQREWDASEAGQRAARENEWARQAQAGEITWTEYFHLMYPGQTDAEIEQGLGMTLVEYEALWKN